MSRLSSFFKFIIFSSIAILLISFFIMEYDKDAYLIPFSFCQEKIDNICFNKFTFFDSLSVIALLLASGIVYDFLKNRANKQ
ncbi:MAG: hypothetical protein JXR48_09610 [Candidatus Delongbacteria bacterium]|nr:hypothetical protein [Candidatus Delongbacteria bacterium]MBN2835209.1 hypothetical protein [Candidatus Delongbacteria bacterium]